MKRYTHPAESVPSIVNDILDISKLESGKLEMYSTQYDTPSLINDIAAFNSVRIGEKPTYAEAGCK